MSECDKKNDKTISIHIIAIIKEQFENDPLSLNVYTTCSVGSRYSSLEKDTGFEN